MWKNKHLIVAMLVAPCLGIMGWFAVDWFVAEQPHAAKSGASYSLIAKSNCRYNSGECELTNNDFKLIIRPAQLYSYQTLLTIDSEFALGKVSVALVSDDVETPAVVELGRESNLSERWEIRIPAAPEETSTLRIAVAAQGAVYYAEVPVIFLVPEAK